MSETPKCWCRKCRPITMDDMRFVTCPSCGDKRCVHAENHEAPCAKDNIFAHNSFVERKLTAERERADRNQEDAERYRWLQSEAKQVYMHPNAEIDNRMRWEFPVLIALTCINSEVSLNAAIDAARRK